MPNYILKNDYESLQRQRDQLLTELREVGNEIRETLEQGAETWHDNAPFEAAIAREKTISTRLRELSDIAEDSELLDPPQVGETVIVGSHVVLMRDDELREYVIGGVYTDPEVYLVRSISSHSPLALQLIGKSIDDEVLLKIPGLPGPNGVEGEPAAWRIVDIKSIE